MTPFVGAGLSRPYGFQLWDEFLRGCSFRAGVDLAKHIAGGDFEQGAEAVVATRGRSWLNREISRRFGRTPRQLEGTAASILPRLVSGPVVTTNFDHVLESVFSRAGLPFDHEIWSGKPLLARRALREKHHVLIKIHGDARTAHGRVLTRAEYEQHYGERGVLAEMLVVLFAAKPVLFVGCRVQSDRYLQMIRRATPAGTQPHFAILPMPGSAVSRKKRTAALAGLGIQPIWYVSPDYESITAFLDEIAPPPPRNPIADRALRQVEELEARIAAVPTADAKLALFLNHDGMFWTGGLQRDYIRIGVRMLRLAEKHGHSCAALRIANDMASMRLFDDRFLGRMLRRCERHLPYCKDLRARGDYRYNLAIYSERRDPAVARTIYRGLLRSRGAGVRAGALRRLAEMEHQAGAPTKRVLNMFHRAIKMSREDPAQEARGYERLGAFLEGRGDPAAAAQAHRSAAALYTKLGDHDGIGSAWNQAGIAALAQHQWRAAIGAFRRALKYAQVAGNPDLVTAVRMNLAWVFHEHAMALRKRKGKAADVRRKLTECDEQLADILAQQTGGRQRAQIMMQRALVVFHLRENVEEALALLTTAAAPLRRYKDGWLWMNYYNRGAILFGAGEIARAYRTFAAALALARQRGNDEEEQHALGMLRRCGRRLSRARGDRPDRSAP